ncbi:MAG: beta-hydroxyacyl-ACP dehydratase [Verrucomicrobia bacterium]|nr:beta-hydroxyacyl-ACP dehydratase [Verrucomicrobiota bacterium]
MNTPLKHSLSALPHGPDFRFVDELTAVNPGISASGLYTIKGTEDFLAAHFPGNPLMPGVLMIEAIAQVAGIAAQSDSTNDPAFANLRLAAVSQAKIFGAARPDDQLAIHAKIVAVMGGLIQAEGHIVIVDEDRESDSPIAKCQITLSVAS